MLTLSKHAGVGGEIKQRPEDFVVKEITERGYTLEPGEHYDAASLGEQEAEDGKHISFVMQKRDWNTMNALRAIAKKLGHGKKSVGYAGTKDKLSISVQLASVFHTKPFDLSTIRIKDIAINGQWRSNGVALGSNLGNAFDVVIRGATDTDAMNDILEELGGRMPNYFGPQRFGERLNNQEIGLCILRNDLEGAVLEFLTGTDNERNKDVTNARKSLSEERDFTAALKRFPVYLRGERAVLAHLAKYKSDYAGAIRTLPRGLSLMFIHAVQDTIFNSELEERVRGNDLTSGMCVSADFYGFPDLQSIGESGEFPVACIVGYETKDEEMNTHTKEIMERMGIRKESFKLSSLPELSVKGSYRPLVVPVKDFRHSIIENDARLRFSLSKGSYATILLDEFMKRDKP